MITSSRESKIVVKKTPHKNKKVMHKIIINKKNKKSKAITTKRTNSSKRVTSKILKADLPKKIRKSFLDLYDFLLFRIKF